MIFLAIGCDRCGKTIETDLQRAHAYDYRVSDPIKIPPSWHYDGGFLYCAEEGCGAPRQEA